MQRVMVSRQFNLCVSRLISCALFLLGRKGEKELSFVLLM